MVITPETPDIAVPLAEFIAAHYPPTRAWPPEILLRWVQWNLGENFLGHVVEGEDNGVRRIVGIGVARPVMKPEDGLKDCCFDPEGSCLFVDMVVTTKPNAMLCLLCSMRQRFGLRPTMAYQRRGRDKVVVRSFDNLHRRIFTAERVEKLASQQQ